MPCYWPTKKRSKGIFIRMNPPKCPKSHCEFTMAQKSCQQGCKLITGGVTPKRRHFRNTDTGRFGPCDNIKQKKKRKKKAPPKQKHGKATVHWHWAISAWSHGVTWRRLQPFINSLVFFFGFFFGRKEGRKAEKKTAAGTLGPSMLSELLRPISYGNQHGRMQSIAKQVTLAPTATHKTAKTQGYLAVTLAWRLKRRLNRGENKATV